MTDFISGSYAVFFREMILLKNKVLRFGYVFYSISSPVIYLLAFGLGLGSRISINGAEYGAFLVQGIVCMSSMTNSYNLVVTSVSIGRLHSGSFQTIMTSPISSFSVMAGLIMSGIVRGFLASLFIVAAGFFIFKVFPFTTLSLVALILNVALFSAFGVITGVLLTDMESNAVITNFIIMPMSFFSGTFYPIDYLPSFLKYLVYILPLSHTNIVMRADIIDGRVLTSLGILIFLSVVSFIGGSLLLNRYSE